jgi:hypothetical protein
MVLSRLAFCQTHYSQRENHRMIFQRLRETLYFFWHHLTPLLARLLPALPLLAWADYRFLSLHGGKPESALQDPLVLLPQMLAGLFATIVTIHYALAVVRKEAPTLGELWSQAMLRALPLAAVQILAGLLILGGLLLLIVPGIYLMGALLPAYVLAVQEEKGPLEALKASWERFRGQAWVISANLCALFLGLMLVLRGLESLGQLLAAEPLALRLAAESGLDLVGLLFSQMIGILLVRFYELEQAPPVKAGWN